MSRYINDCNDSLFFEWGLVVYVFVFYDVISPEETRSWSCLQL